MKKKDEGERRSGLNSTEAAVRHMATQAQIKQDEIAAEAAGKDGRGRPGNAGEVGRDRRGITKATYALRIARQELVRAMAAKEDVSQTDIVELAIVALHNAWKAGRVDMDVMKKPIKSLNFSWHLEVDDDFFLE